MLPIPETKIEAYLDAIAKKLAEETIDDLPIPETKIQAYLDAIAEIIEPNGLPSVTEADNGKFLCVVNGAWTAVTIPEANGEDF